MGIVTLVLRLLGWFLILAGPGYLGMHLGAANFNAPGDLWVRAFVYANVGGLLLWVASLIDGKHKKRSAPLDHARHPAHADGTRVAPLAGPEPAAGAVPVQTMRQESGHQQALQPTTYFFYCMNCGRQRTSGEKFCHGCGAPLTADLTRPSGHGLLAEPAARVVAATASPGVLHSAETVYGGFGVRVAAAVIDWVVLIILGYIMGFVLGGYMGASAAQAISPFVAGIVLPTCYIGCIPLLGATPGKLVLGYHIVGSDGRHVGYWRALGRELSKILSGLVILLGFVWIGIDKRKQGWHDKIAGTFIVRKEFVDRKGQGLASGAVNVAVAGKAARKRPSTWKISVGVAVIALGFALAAVSGSQSISNLLRGSGQAPGQTPPGDLRRTEDQILERMRQQIEIDEFGRRQQNPNRPMFPVPSFR